MKALHSAMVIAMNQTKLDILEWLLPKPSSFSILERHIVPAPDSFLELVHSHGFNVARMNGDWVIAELPGFNARLVLKARTEKPVRFWV